MKILEFELFSEYRKIKQNKKFKFKKNNVLCLTGKNGSGKTNLFELILGILNTAMLNDQRVNVKLFYCLKIELKKEEIYIEHNSNGLEIYKLENENKVILTSEYLKNNLNIIVYSSAKRTVLSETHYFNILSKTKNNTEYFEEYFNYFIREKLKKCILIYLLLFKYEELRNILKGIMEIKQLKEIRVEIKSELKIGLRKEQREAIKNIFSKTYKELKKGVKVQLDTNDLLRIKNYYKDNEFEFFSLLETLERLNFINAFNLDEYEGLLSGIISEKTEDNYASKEFFISKILLEDSILFNYLSEGELQLLETIGTILLFQSKEYKKENLYIFDEPTTHLNTGWLAEYITLLKKVLSLKSSQESRLESQLIFSTHNLDIISDLPVENLHLIEEGEFKQIKEETFGSNEFKLNKILFNKDTSVSNNVLSKMNEYYEKIEEITTKRELEQIEYEVDATFGSSPEKYKLLKYIQDKFFKIGDYS